MVDFEREIARMRELGVEMKPNTISIKIPNAKEMLQMGLNKFCGEQARWLKEYDEIAEWLSDNKGRGLLCHGSCGLGKSLICGKIVPILINHYYGLNVCLCDGQSMNEMVDTIKQQKLIYIDDIGTEHQSVKFGERRETFPEIVDEAEKKGKFLIVTTNLSMTELKAKYGERTLDRLRAITKRVKLEGKSLRK